MFPSTLSFLALTLWICVAHQSGFTSPNYIAAYGYGDFESNVVWYVGQNREVVYDISDIDGLENYTIALWQQSIIGGGATLGPVVNSTTLPDVRDSFNWTVQLYDFDLSISNVFFFWLFNGSESSQGDTSVRDVSSAYFNISNEDVSSSSTSASLSSATSQSTSSATSLTAASATTASAAGDSSSSSSGSTGGGGISTGAGIGIGVGVGLVGVCALACAGLVIWYKRRQANGRRDQEFDKLPPDNNTYTKPLDGYTVASSNDTVLSYGKAVNGGTPAELNGGGIYTLVEMDADGTNRR
ncbi:hypothetical protein VMCG_10614 [Cytospora schulzeri]|uniref:Mid2 domain-containing protein n=1 Tax=Cytospora schulzeri TaxID=448051 RepID=A0A423V9Q6_9PEZI|nr:hypothetical protein VMCG_10614 [Valsa malicola]